jgi:hypothetical protein
MKAYKIYIATLSKENFYFKYKDDETAIRNLKLKAIKERKELTDIFNHSDKTRLRW